MEKLMTLWELSEKFSDQMMIYNPIHHLYYGDERMRMVVFLNQEQARKRVRSSADRSEKGPITKSGLGSATHARHKVGRLCGDLDHPQKQIYLVVSSNNVNPCGVCGLDCYTTCGLCKRASVHFFSQKGSQKSKACFAGYHSDQFLA